MRVLIVAAHPDDETIGASSLLGPPHESAVIHVTDGAPRDSRWWPNGVADRRTYAAVRAYEAERALSLVRADRVALGIAGEEAVYEIARIARLVADEIERRETQLVVTHAYEGGHPDHDAVALAVARARRLIPRGPSVYEMAMYHAGRGTLVAGKFLDDGAASLHVLDREQRRRRRAMLACYASQQAALAPFLDGTEERFRRAPRYDFARPPHPGKLHYERMGFAMTGDAWRAIAAGG